MKSRTLSGWAAIAQTMDLSGTWDLWITLQSDCRNLSEYHGNVPNGCTTQANHLYNCFCFYFFQWSPTRNRDFTKDLRCCSANQHRLTIRGHFAYFIWRKSDTCLTYRLRFGLYNHKRRWACALRGTYWPLDGGISTKMQLPKHQHHYGMDITTNQWRLLGRTLMFETPKRLLASLTVFFFSFRILNLSGLPSGLLPLESLNKLQQAWTVTFGCPLRSLDVRRY